MLSDHLRSTQPCTVSTDGQPLFLTFLSLRRQHVAACPCSFNSKTRTQVSPFHSFPIGSKLNWNWVALTQYKSWALGVFGQEARLPIHLVIDRFPLVVRKKYTPSVNSPRTSQELHELGALQLVPQKIIFSSETTICILESTH